MVLNVSDDLPCGLDFTGGLDPIAQVDLGRLAGNLATLCRKAPGVQMLGVVKADAYGHGAVPVAKRLVAEGVAGLCVANLREGLELREQGLTAPILSLGDPDPALVPLASAQRIDLGILSLEHLKGLRSLLAQHPVALHLKVDTGMGNTGLQLSEVGAALEDLRALGPHLRGLMAHFASADEPDPEPSRRQREAFRAVIAQLADAGLHPPMLHHGNTAAALKGFTEGDTHMRCGIGLYGMMDMPEADAAGLQPVLELTAPVVRVAQVPAGLQVGYGGTYTTQSPVSLATLACGYADGYSRILSNRAQVGWKGRLYPLVGRVSMDVVVAELPWNAGIRPGDRMTLLSAVAEDPHSVRSTARLLNTIPYEVTCALSRRVRRVPL